MGRMAEWHESATYDPEFDLDQLYFEWLNNIAGVDQPPPQFGTRTHRLLANVLYQIKFYSDVPNDVNRIMDAVDLRRRFLDEENFSGFFPQDIIEPVSFYEVLVVLAIRCEEVMHSENFGDRTAFWFYSMIENAGLIIFWDQEWYTGAIHEIRHKCDCILDRKYNRRGEGGLFPLKRSRNDQRYRELWFQMVDWLNANFRKEMHL